MSGLVGSMTLGSPFGSQLKKDGWSREQCILENEQASSISGLFLRQQELKG